MGFFHESPPNKIKIITYTAISNGISNLIHNLNYNPVTDDLNVVDLTCGQQLSVGDNYTENANLISIDLIGWTLNSGDKISFHLTKNVK